MVTHVGLVVLADILKEIALPLFALIAMVRVILLDFALKDAILTTSGVNSFYILNKNSL